MATETVSVAASADDGYGIEPNSTPDNSGTSCFVGQNGTPSALNSFFRFLSVDIPAGATISSAYIEIVANGSSGTLSNVATRIYAEDTDSAAVIQLNTTDFYNRVRTTAFTAWTPSAWVQDTAYQSPDIAAVIQEVIDRAGWSSGNALHIFWDDAGSSSSTNVKGATYDHATLAAPKLVVTYSTVSTITDPALSDADTLNTDSFVRLISDPSLSDADSLYLDTLVQLVTITDQLLSASNTLNVDVLTRSPLTDQFLSDADTLNVDVLTGDVNVFPTWIWCFVRQDGNLFLAPRKSLRSWRNPNADIVSEFFQFSIDLETYAMSKVAAAWAANAAADTATLKAAIDSALSSAGFKDRYGNPL